MAAFQATTTPAPSRPRERGLVGDLVTVSQPLSGYPRAIVTSDGTLLVTHKWRDDTTTKIITKGSRDQGATWSDPVDVVSFDASKFNLNNPFLFQRSSGELLCAYKRSLLENGEFSENNLDVSRSTDQGQSWSKIGTIVTESAEVVKGEWEPFLHGAPDETLQVYYSHEYNPADQDIVKRTSSDRGKTWSDMVTVTGAGVTHVRPGMPQVLGLDDGGMHQMMVYESNPGGAMKVWAQTSSDGGKTWVNPHIIFDPGKGNAGGPGVVQTPSGLVVSFMTDQDHPVGKYPNLEFTDTKVITSNDGGATWSPPTKVIPQAGWGGVTAVEGGVMVLAATHVDTVVMQKFAP